MDSLFAAVSSVLTAYIIGAFPTSFIMAKALKGIDIRQFGSKNVGATNTFRVVGKAPGIITLIIDILKGILAVTIAAKFFYPHTKNLDYNFYQGLLGFAAVCGHVWPVFLKFKGGKGVATTIGVGIVIAPKILLPTVIIWAVIFFITNYVSLASIVALIIFPIIACIMNSPFYTILFSVMICCLSIYKHKSNIERLIKGCENKVIIFNKK